MNLLFDADDTLWENIRVFNQINDHYAGWIGPERKDELLAHLDQIQQSFVKLHGYGSKTFALSLQEGIRRFAGREPDRHDLARIERLVHPLRWESIEVRTAVPETLTRLREQHHLIMFTKGEEAEQQLKVDRSGLRPHFSSVVVVADKHTEAYVDAIERHGLDPDETWMIGNSPRSDVNPALEAGLGAVHVPHPETWGHEHDVVDHAHPRFRRVETFAGLLDLF